MKIIFLLLALSALESVPAFCSSIVGSKHDLSAGSSTSGPKAVSENQICIFCHTPHKSGVNVPLWNHTVTTQTFTFYSSYYVNSYLGMTAPNMTQLTGSRTKLCLSCHDGVTALGGLYNAGGSQSNVDIIGSLGTSANLGTDLSNDHPVLYDVSPGAGPPSAPGTNPEIQIPSSGDAVQVYGTTNRVECTSCHDAHDNQYGDFLVKSNANSALCTTCHVKSGFSSSIHATSAISYTPSGESATTVGERSCRSCHRAHGASSSQAYLLRESEESVCYQCHGNPAITGASNIESLFAKTYKHPTESISSVHINPEEDGSNFTSSPNNRHSECQDCHNPHQMQSGTHSPTGNLISNVLLGQWGVEPSYGSTAWVPASSYTKQTFSNTTGYKEYQLCLKCHSSYAYDTTPPSGSTDQSTEFNINNKSAHPVINTLNNQSGSSSPKALDSSALSTPWDTNPGNQNMYCSDCHGEDTSGDPTGPHGSNYAYMLKGTAKYWPLNASGNMWTLYDVYNNRNNWSTDLFCVNCHPIFSGGSWMNNVHPKHGTSSWGLFCVSCHIAVPHGSRRSRLIGYKSDPSPYKYGRYLLPEGFKKASDPFSYVGSDCYTTSSCSTAHSSSVGPYEP